MVDYNYKKQERDIMVIRVLLLLFALLILVNLCIMAASYMLGQNLYQKYGKQILIAFCIFVFIVAALYVALALIGLG